MRRATKAKRSLQVVILSTLVFAVIAGGYLVFRYPSLIPPLNHKDNAKTPQAPVTALSNDTSQPLEAQSALHNNSLSSNPDPVKSIVSSSLPDASAISSTTATMTPSLAVSSPLPNEPSQAGPAGTGSLQFLTGQAQTPVKNLFSSLSSL